MPLRTLVSFEADVPTSGQPPGRELATLVSASLRQAGIDHRGPAEREGWAWEVFAQDGATQIECIIGFSNDGPRQWQIHTYGHLGLFKRLSQSARAQRDVALRKFCGAIDRAINSDPRFRTIRWYEAQVFDRDHGETWGNDPG